MDIAFTNVPSNLREPFFFAEVSNSRANTNQQSQRGLIIGQVGANSGLTPNVPAQSAGAAEAVTLCGAGSMLQLMVAAYESIDTFGEIWYGPLADAAGAVAASGSILFAGPLTAAGELSLYIAACDGTDYLPDVIDIPLTSGMTAAQVATAVAAAINETLYLPVTAAVDGVTPAKVDLTALNKGAAGNDIDIRVNYQGTAGGEATPAGLTVTITPMAGGAVNPSLTTLLGNLLDKPFDFIITPYTDAASIAAITNLLNDVSGRWSWQNQVYGGAWMAYRNTYAGLGTWGQENNDQHTSCLGFYDSPSPNFVWAAAYAAACAVSIRANPSVPLQDLALPCVYAPPLQSRFDLPLRNALAFDGVSTFKVSDADVVTTSSVITTYQKNAQGAPDNSYLRVNTLYQLMSYLRQRAQMITSKYGRVTLVDNTERVPPGSNCVTPNTIKADLIAQYQSLSPGLVQDATAYAAGLTVQINSENTDRVDVLDDPILTGGITVFAMLAQFQLAAPSTTTS